MLFLISPAKALDYDTPVPAELPHTRPLFARQSAELIGVMRQKTSAQVAQMMELSESLADLNVKRYKAWSSRFTAKNSRQAVLAFDGDVYGGLQARSLGAEDLDWAQQHLCILSGLYGVLRPLDWIQPYRLEMGVRVATTKAKDLYGYWNPMLTDYLNQRLKADASPVLVNLASTEYFGAVQRKALKARVVECRFEDFHGGSYKVISFNAKRARGLMARYAVQQRAMTPKSLENFTAEGFAFAPAVSQPDQLVFRRKL